LSKSVTTEPKAKAWFPTNANATPSTHASYATFLENYFISYIQFNIIRMFIRISIIVSG